MNTYLNLIDAKRVLEERHAEARNHHLINELRHEEASVKGKRLSLTLKALRFS